MAMIIRRNRNKTDSYLRNHIKKHIISVCKKELIFLVTKVNDLPAIFQIDIPLPDNPLKNLNCYVLQSGKEALIIDTGFNRPECEKALENGIKELGIEYPSLFLTHLHSDHTGLVHKFKDCPIYMGKIDYDYLVASINGNTWLKTDQKFEQEGFPKEYIKILQNTNPARSFAPNGMFKAIPLKDGDTIQIGDCVLQTILVPGHTPGQMCLYIPQQKILFTADHILFDITPNITSWIGIENSLGDYIKSLNKIKQIPIQIAFPAHRKNDSNIYTRIEQIIQHHKMRLEDTIYILSQKQPLTAYKIASFLKWSMRGKCWEEFPISQRWFAVGETIAHLDYLIAIHVVERLEGNINHYRLLCSKTEAKNKIAL